MVLRQPKIRMDSLPAPRQTAANPAPRKETLNPEIMRQLSGGSVTGFIAGLVISVFSKTLVLLLGISIVLIQVAARYGINIMQQLRVKERVEESRVIAALRKDPAYKISFGLFFAMSAFMKF